MKAVRLSEQERRVLAHSQLAADLSPREIARLAGCREHVARYALSKATDEGVIRERCFIDLCRLGYTQFEVYFSLSSERKAVREAIINSLLKSEQISWMGEFGGDYQWAFNFCAKNVSELAEFFDKLSKKFGKIFLEKAVACRLALYYFGDKYLADIKRKPSSFSYTATDKHISIDELDSKILHGLSNIKHTSILDLSRKLAIPHSTLEYRIKALQQAGVIVGFYNELTSTALGMQSFLLLIGSKSISRELQRAVYCFCESHPNISVLINSIGSWDFEINADVANAREAVVLSQEIQDRFGEELSFVKVLPSFGYLKIAEFPF